MHVKAFVLCDITNSLETSRGLMYNMQKCDVETRNLQYTYAKNELFSEVGHIQW